MVERETGIPENMMFRSHDTEFKELENYLSKLPRSPGQLLLQRRVASSG